MGRSLLLLTLSLFSLLAFGPAFAQMEVKDLPQISEKKYTDALEQILTHSSVGISLDSAQGIYEGECYSKSEQGYSHFSENTYLVVQKKDQKTIAFAWHLPDYYSPFFMMRAFNPYSPNRALYSDLVLADTFKLLNGEFLNHEVKDYELSEAEGRVLSTAFTSYQEKSNEYQNWVSDFYTHEGGKILLTLSKGNLRLTYPANEPNVAREMICVWFNKLR